MRLVLHGDVTAVARVLMSVTADRRNLLCSSILSQAHSADCYRKRFKAGSVKPESWDFHWD